MVEPKANQAAIEQDYRLRLKEILKQVAKRQHVTMLHICDRAEPPISMGVLQNIFGRFKHASVPMLIDILHSLGYAMEFTPISIAEHDLIVVPRAPSGEKPAIEFLDCDALPGVRC